ncbi:AraC family transcriptional regulator [Sulfitobacter sp. S190]|uniref:helix-turn-helix domain-containing protein n=1 Tax=Sulfitobacter sp. S190 TaxID=2867022 RepID=UPI0021A57CDA|nr:helix-turn-helix domain-containing protein [Sulfitobacter sp. S190]UWR21201.1 helix-turn-helix domain-containing protein [Sulfitobacter sp. S190]
MPSLPIPVFASAVLMFLFIRLWVTRGALSPIAVLLAVCALQTAILALAQHYMVPGMRFVQPVTATLIPPAAWCAFQWTAVRPTRRGDLLHLLVPATAVAALTTAPGFLDIFVPGAFIIYGGAILVLSCQGPDAQPRAYLANGNLPSRIWQVIGAALIVSALSDVLILAAIALGFDHLRPWIISLFSIGNLLLIGIISLSSHLQSEETGVDAPLPGTSEAEQQIWTRVQAYMADQRPYLDPDLTLSRLSRKLGVPAKTLSTIINRETGANVSRYVNDARIAAAQKALLRGESVTSAMLSSGFNTKSNFNREFLRITGTSPSKWVQKQTPLEVGSRPRGT